MTVPLQTLGPELTLKSAIYGILALTLFLTLLAITYISYQGYRQDQSRPMKFFALGFGCLLLTQIVVYPVNSLLETDQFFEQTTVQLSQVLGGLLILYAIRIEE